MLPIIYIANDKAEQEAYIAKFIKEGNYLPYYVFRIEPVKTEISIDQIRAVKKEIVTHTPHTRLFIIFAFDTASLEAQNAFLKTLEEKNENNQFVMCATDLGRVIPTIQSRSKVISGEKGRVQEIQTNSVGELFNKLEQNPDLSFLSSVASMNREGAIQFFDHSIIYLETQLKEGKQTAATVLKKALSQKSLLLNNNLNPQLAVDAFLLFALKQYKRS